MRDHAIGRPTDSGEGSDRVELLLRLRHSQGLGELAPYFRGLREGRTIAARCPDCARTWFPPRLTCPDHTVAVEWVELSGSGRIVSLTVTSAALPFTDEVPRPQAFALVRVDGAENLALARLAGPPDAYAPDQAVWLSRADNRGPHPSQAACFVASEAERRIERAP